MTDYNVQARQKQLKSIITRLHDGVPAKKLKKEFARLIKNTTPEEIADMENRLIREGFPPQEIQRLCDVHAQVFEQSLKKAGKTGKIPGHPIHTFKEENKKAKKILKELVKTARKLRKKKPDDKDIEYFKKLFGQFHDIEKHYQRKENQLFPMLEAKQFTGPTQVMWGKHDEVRLQIKKIDHLIAGKDWGKVNQELHSLSSAVKKLIFLEEKILYPTSAKKLSNMEWAKIKKGESDIGYAWISPSNLWDAKLAEKQSQSGKDKLMPEESDHRVHLSHGKLTSDQINLLLKNLPVDITFVDENDTVRYFSDSKDRIFSRSRAIIGRQVQNCHPPKSVHIVEDILKNFKEKKKDCAEFWINLKGRLVHIRYFALYDENGKYKGVIEVSQDITGIKNLKGERRLLDW